LQSRDSGPEDLLDSRNGKGSSSRVTFAFPWFKIPLAVIVRSFHDVGEY
jgi:hypothetical protein